MVEKLKNLGYTVFQEGEKILFSLKKTQLYKKLTSYKFYESMSKSKNCIVDKAVLIKNAASWSKSFVKNNPKTIFASISSAGLITAGYLLKDSEIKHYSEEILIVSKDFSLEQFDKIPNFIVYGLPTLVKNLF